MQVVLWGVPYKIFVSSNNHYFTYITKLFGRTHGHIFDKTSFMFNVFNVNY